MTDEEFEKALKSLHQEAERRLSDETLHYTRRQWAAVDNLEDSLNFMIDTLAYPNG